MYFKAAVPNLFGTRDQFVEDDFSMDWGSGGGFGMIQAHYNYYALFSIIIISAPPQIIRH